MIIDSFPAFKEIELAQFRIMYLANLVDLTIIAEARLTQSGLEKPLYFRNWLSNQTAEFKSRVIIIEVPLLEASTSWEREIYTREYLFDHIKVNYPSAKFILSDLDEIPSLEQVESLRTTSGLFHFLTPTFYRKINWQLRDQHIRWSHGVMGEVALNIFPNAGRFSKQIPILMSVPGAHFSWLGIDEGSLWEKSKAAAHSELNENFWASHDLLRYCDKYRVDHLGRGRNQGWGMFNVTNPKENGITAAAYKFFPGWADVDTEIPRIGARFWASMKVTSFVADTKLASYARKRFEPDYYFTKRKLGIGLIVAAETLMSSLSNLRIIIRRTRVLLWKALGKKHA
jgi:hypothetical protein